MKASTHIHLVIAALLLSQFAISQSLVIEYNGSSAQVTVCENNLADLIFTAVTDSLDNDCEYDYSWSITVGNGTLTQNVNDSLEATYSFSGNPMGPITIKVEGVPSGDDCEPVPFEDTLVISIEPAPDVNPGGPYSVCADNAEVSLDGNVSGASGGIWSGGGENFANINEGEALATYTPTPAEISSGSVTLTLTSSDDGFCLPVDTSIVITIIPAPIVDAGGPYTACTNQPEVELAGEITNADGGQWSGGDGLGSFSPSSTDINATYIPSQAEVDFGSVTLTLVSTSNDNCLPEYDTTTITYTTAYSVDTLYYGSGIFCNDDQSTQFPQFSGTPNGTFGCQNCDSFNAIDGSFVPGENNPGNYTITYSIAPSGGCAALDTSITITINPAPEVSAEGVAYPFTDLCNLLPVELQGSTQNSTGIEWSANIAGGSFDDATMLDATYTSPGSYIGEIQFEITATGQPACSDVSDSFTFNLIPAPEASIAPLPDHFCTEDTVTLSIGTSPFNAYYDVEWTTNNIIGSNTGSQVQFIVPNGESVSVTLTQSINGTCLSEITYNFDVFQRPLICDYFELAGAILSVNPCDLDQDYFYQWGCGTSALEGENNNYLLYSPYLDECNDDFYVAVSLYETGVCPAYGGNNPTTSITETDFSEMFRLFPNPATDLIRLLSHQGAFHESALFITDLKGRIIAQRKIQNGETEIVIHTSNFEAGSYFLTLQGDNWLARKTFVVIN